MPISPSHRGVCVWLSDCSCRYQVNAASDEQARARSHSPGSGLPVIDLRMLPIHTNYTIPQASVRRGVQFPTAPEIPPCASSLELASTAGFVRSLLLLVHALSPLVPSRKYRPLFTAAARSAQGELGCLSSRDARAGPIEALAEISHFIAAANAVLAQRARLLWITVFITYDFTPAAHGPGHLVSRDFKRTHCQHRIHRQHIANQSTGHHHHHSIQRCCRRCSSSSTRISIPPY